MANNHRRELLATAGRLFALGVAAAIAFQAARFYACQGWLGGDARAYWAAWHEPVMYGRPPGTLDAYLYSPAFAEVVRPLAFLPRETFCIVWIASEAAILAWLLRPLGPLWGCTAFLLCVPELCLGNVYGLFALVLVLGFRTPQWWVIPALTKIVTAQGLLWFAVRREWRSLAKASAFGIAVVGVSAAISPHLWTEWFNFLNDYSLDTGTQVRVGIACLLTAYAALTNRPWLLPVAVFLACPKFNVLKGLAILAAIPRIVHGQRSTATARESSPELAGSPRGSTSDLAAY